MTQQPQPLFFAPPEHEKVAGYKLPSNPRFWHSEIIRYLKSQHPYLPVENSEIDIRRMDATKGAAVGSVILGEEIAVPIIISRPRPGADPELASMDVFFHKGQYRFLDPESLKSAVHSPQIGEPEPRRNSRAFGGNPYVGDMTGDATPLEYSGQASPFAGPYDGTKMSMDISHELLPEYLIKAAETELREKMKDTATTFGITGAIGGGVRGAITGKGGAKGKALEALKQSLIGATTGTAAGVALPVAKKALGLAKKEKKQQAKVIKTVVKSELSKAADFTCGLERVLETGLTAGLIKNAYLDPNDISNFRNMIATNPHILQGSGHNFKLVEIVARRGPEPATAKGSIVKTPNIMQVYERNGEVYIKFSGGPEAKTDKAELQRLLGDRYAEVSSKLRSGGVYMRHDGVNQVTWDVKRPAGEAKAVTRDGLYSVRTRDGENIVGMAVQAVMDLDGKTLPLKLFVTPEGKYTLTGEMFGVRMADKHRLPSQVPAGGQTGTFINYVHGTPIATIPFRLTSIRRVKPEDGDERLLYVVYEPMTGQRFTLSPVRGVQGFERMHVVDPGVRALADGPVYYIPGDSEWVTLRNPVRLAENTSELQKISSADDEGVHVTYTGGQWNIDACLAKEAFVGNLLRTGAGQIAKTITKPGVVGRNISNIYGKAGGGLKGAARVARIYAPGATMAAAPLAAAGAIGRATAPKQAQWHGLDEPGAREMLLAMGMPGDDVVTVVGLARERQGLDRGLKLAGLHWPQIQGHEIIEAPRPTYGPETERFVGACRPDAELLKAAAESGHPETLDSLLSLEFITPQNLRYFIDNVPDFEEAATRLAALLVAVRLGMPHVPEQPVRDALEGLSKTVGRLQILKSAIQNKNERASTAE